MEGKKEKVKKYSQFREVMHRLTKNRLAMVGLVIVILVILIAIFADVLAPYPYNEQDYMLIRQKGSIASGHILGTDSLGRDMLSRLIYGSRYSLTLGLLSTLMAAAIGMTLGSIAGYFGGNVDNVIMRFLDIYQSIPSLLLCLLLASVMGPSLRNSVIAIAVTTCSGFARMIRASIMQVSGMEYVEAAKAINAKDFRILMKHIMPNAISPMIVQISMNIGASILAGSTLGFVGLGVQPPLPEWGTMLADCRNYLRDSGYLLLYPGIAIFVCVMAFNLLGDGLRDALDPRLKD